MKESCTNICTFFRKTDPENILQYSDKYNNKNNDS